LSREVSNIAPAVIATFEKSNLFGVEVQVAGWTKSIDSTSSNILKTANLKILSDDECKHIIYLFNKFIIQIDEFLFCTKADPYVLITDVSIPNSIHFLHFSYNFDIIYIYIYIYIIE
jgi:hypothetical protein